MTLPTYENLSAPLWLLTTLHVITLTLHFVAMNFIVGGLFFLLFGNREGGTTLSPPATRRIVRVLPSIMAATVTLGIAPLLFLQLVYSGPVYSAAIASGWLWLAVIAAAIGGYALLYAAAFAQSDRRVGALLGLALPLFLYISLVYSSVFAMAERPEVYRALHAANPAGLGLNPNIGNWMPRWVHMLLGAGTVGSYLMALLAVNEEKVFKRARLFFTVFMAATMLAGFIYLLALNEILKPLMHGAAIWFLTTAVLLSLGALHSIWKSRPRLAGILLLSSLPCMVIVRHQVRLILLADTLVPAKLPVQSNWGLIGIFLACFVVSLALCGWMAVLFLRQPERKQAEEG
jgi:hypothetical protein